MQRKVSSARAGKVKSWHKSFSFETLEKRTLLSASPAVLASPSLSISDATQLEGNAGTSEAVFTVKLSAPSATKVTVRYATVDGTASAEDDFDEIAGKLTFRPGETEKTIRVGIGGDTEIEPDEQFKVQLTRVSGATLADAEAIGTIRTDDAPVTDPPDTDPPPGGDTGQAPFTAKFTLTQDWGSGFGGEISVTNNGTTAIDNWRLEFDFDRQITALWNAALAEHTGNHYVIEHPSWAPSIAPGATVSFGFNGGAGNATSQPTGYTLNGLSTDNRPKLSIGDVSVAESGSGASALFTVQLSTPSTQPITVNYATADRTATAGTDYQAVQGTLTIPAGQTKGTITVPVIDDTQSEPSEAFLLSLSGAVGATIGRGEAVGTVLDNDATGGNNGGNGGNGGNDSDDSENPSSKRVIGYYTAWSTYGRDYQVSEIPADKLTHINYAFANISSEGTIALGDPYADVDKFLPGDSWDNGALRGNFHQLQKLKEANPNLSTLISVGGWTWSSRFSDVALTDASREKFVASCVEFVQKYGFDGVDIDWEYPVSGGLDGTKHRPEDKQNYTLLMQEFRRQFDALEATTGKHYLLSIAAPAGPANYSNMELAALAQSVDWINLMTYDFHGGWDAATNFNSPLYASAADPTADPTVRTQFNTDSAVDGYLAAGVPADKIVIGVPFYGRGWSGVADVNHGLFQSAAGLPQGTWEAGVFDYHDLKDHYLGTYDRYWSDEAQVPWLYNPQTKTMISYDDPQSLGVKARYVRDRNLGGVMFWDLSGDDAQHSLVNALQTNLAATDQVLADWTG
jgi:chitinase